MNRDSIRINTNGQVPLADTGSGASGSVTGTERLAVQEATDANTASKIVKRDASGNFSAGTITASLTGNVSGTASGLSAGADRTKLDSIDQTTTIFNPDVVDWHRNYLPNGKRIFVARVATGSLPSSPDLLVLDNKTFPNGLTQSTCVAMCSVLAKNGQQIHAALRPVSNGEYNVSESSTLYQLAISTLDATNLSSKATVAVVVVTLFEV